MLFLTIIKVALKSLYANKLRSILAMLGIIIGVGAVISMLSIGAGAKKDIMDRIQSMGTNLLSVRPGRGVSRGVSTDARAEMTVDDALAVLSEVDGISRMSPVIDGNGQLKYYNTNTRTQVSGTAVTYPAIRSYEVEHGRYFTDAETDRMARVVVLGPETAGNLGVTKDQLGEKIKIKGINFELIGILKSKGGGGRFNPDDQALVPYTTAMKILFGKDSLDNIDVECKTGVNMTKVEESITNLLRKRHKIINPENNPDNDDFRVFNQADIIETASEMTKTMTFLLGGIAAISLLVGGIGIMNIMLVTVTERTKEIGIRKAIGAKDQDILNQFLIESLIMSCVGGLIGVAAGVGTGFVIGKYTEFSTYVMPGSIALALFFSMGVGIFFGYYPAWRAAQLNPIECLYYE